MLKTDGAQRPPATTSERPASTAGRGARRYVTSAQNVQNSAHLWAAGPETTLATCAKVTDVWKMKRGHATAAQMQQLSLSSRSS